MTTLKIVLCASWLVSAFLFVHLLRGSDSLLFKIGLTITLAMPLLGPVMYLLIQGIPTSQDPDLRDQNGFGGDVLFRWRERLERAGRYEPLRRWGDRKKR
jgi:hypothetical protein